MLKFQISLATIARVNVVLKGNGECWVAGCGDVYDNEQSATNCKKYRNPDVEAATYMLHFKKGDVVPTTVKGMEDALFEARKSEQQEYADTFVKKESNKYSWDSAKNDEAQLEDEIKAEEKANKKVK
jgi:hypothetical protein